ncbi:hypothetical protein LENED_008757 [Lentinula edodes]|uniref:DUF6533 domain-containing protein n=1 Tax=Lentinula edodes TaxID=5353 RepID=A0A1Q3EHV7_LENED|nr:hypothetical protein LENED_008757 [Lentinula edodes]
MSEPLTTAEIQIQVNWNHYMELIEFVILAYDYLLTFDLEIERFWKRDTKRLAAILFFVNRYLTLLGNIPFVLFFRPGLILRYRDILIYVVQINISILFLLRMHAIYGGSKRIAGFLGVVLMGMMVNNVVQLYLADRTGPAAVDLPSASAQVGTIPSFSDTQFGLSVDWNIYGYISRGIGTVVMRDGLMYFGIITLATLANILAFALGTEFTKGLLPIFSNIISSVMMSRLMLNLREDHLNETQISGLIFANNEFGKAATSLFGSNTKDATIMKTAFLTTIVALACTVSAFVTPQVRDGSSSSSTIDDTTILNYALTLEYLESAFYTGALSSFSQDDFTNDGLPEWARGRFEQIAAHEQAHVELLSNALGSNATQACTYSFPYTSPSSFAALSQLLEGVGVSAYAGAAQYITNKEYLTAAAVILSTEARHAAWIAGPVNKENPWSGSLDTPLGLSVVYTLAAQFITGCPSSNPSLPVKAFPALTFDNASPGQATNVTADGVNAEGQYVAFFSGLATSFVQVQNGQVVVPNNSLAYAVLSSSNTTADDSTITAGVAVLSFPFNSNGTSSSSTGDSSMNVVD